MSAFVKIASLPIPSGLVPGVFFSFKQLWVVYKVDSKVTRDLFVIGKSSQLNVASSFILSSVAILHRGVAQIFSDTTSVVLIKIRRATKFLLIQKLFLLDSDLCYELSYLHFCCYIKHF